ncbi:thiamine pyrophosphokinase [Coemansia guatemalensis]|uniref:Thiamine pyrophosphokinase n=1 Tax=Coemansia guatemalensis TaxID=2761395 RepID=A0A9W8HQA3_9FUNG|nr:thiamine pyrophosphokinase [Coemansia guatemalensis]
MSIDDTLHKGSYLLYPDEGLADTAWPKDKELALLILNESIPQQMGALLEDIWARADHRICIDGGGNRLYRFGKESSTLDKFVPDAIVGDLDSLQDEPRLHYAQKGTAIHRYEDQDSTDFMKGLLYLDTVLRKGKGPEDCVVIVFGGLGGRLDHTLHTLKVLFYNHQQRNVVLVSEENLTFVVPRGTNRILTNAQVDGPSCGILPLAGETMLTTKGLRWNLDHQPSSFEGLMSTSNIIDDTQISIETSLPVAWTAQFRPKAL